MIKKPLLFKFCVTTLLAVSAFSCQRTDVLPAKAPIPGAVAPADDKLFDWQNALSPPLISGQTVRMPWAAGGGSTLDIALASDYHAIDGWDMVYNTFDNTVDPRIATQSPLYFALYNRYRGILRYYYFHPGNSGGSSQLEHGLSLNPSTSSSTMLNFEGQDTTDPYPSNNVKGFTQTSKAGFDNSSTWYAMQYQIAYDPKYTSNSYEVFHPHWTIKPVSISSIKTDGVELGSLDGSITTPAPGIDWPAAAANGLLAVGEFVGTASIVGAAVGTAINTTATSTTTTTPSGWQSAASGGLAGNLTGFLSAIFGGNSSNAQEVALTIRSKITTTGTSTMIGGGADVNFWLPGQSSTTIANAVSKPIYPFPIGLFNLSARPKIKLQIVPGPPPQNLLDPTITDYYYTSDVNAVRQLLITNSAVINSDPILGAHIANFNVQTVMPDPGTTGAGTWSISGTQETIGPDTFYTGYPVVAEELASLKILPPPPAYLGAYIRVSFNVKANDPKGPQNILIVRTFNADVVQ